MFDTKVFACAPKRNLDHRFTFLIGISFFILPIILIIFYSLVLKMTLKILKLRQEQHVNIELINLEEIDEIQNLESDADINTTKESLIHSKGLFVISLVFISTLIPFGSVILIEEFFYELPSFIHLYSFLLVRLSSVFNPIFYGLFSSSFMFGYKNVFSIIFHRKKLSFRKYRIKKKKNEQKKSMKKRLIAD